MENPEEKYILAHSSGADDALDWVVRQTHIKTNYPRMLTGSVQGEFLTLLARLTGAREILEVGTFTGYSAICLAKGLPEDGHLDTLEINDELEYLIREGFERAGVADRIRLHLGDALQTLRTLKGRTYDLAYIDADKREYCDYYRLIVELVRPGGCILADDVLWDGKLYADKVPTDAKTLGIAKFNEMVAADPRVEVVLLPFRHGLSLIRKK